jgi:hypothetical protein
MRVLVVVLANGTMAYMKLLLIPIVLISLLLSNCSDPKDDTTVIITNNGPAITLEVAERDFGTIWDFQSVTTTFPFTNTGDKVLVLNRLQAGCGCTVPVADKTVLQPGETGTITVTFDPTGKANKQDKKVTIFSNATDDPEKAFWIRSYVNQFVNTPTKFLSLNEMVLGQEKTIDFEFFPFDPDFKILSMSGIGKHGQFISGEELVVPEGAPRKIRITVNPNMPWGAFHSQLQIKGEGFTAEGEKRAHTFAMFANGKSFGNLRADSHIMSLGSKKQGESYYIKNRIYRPDGEPFKVLNTAVLQPTVPGINLSAVPNLDGSYDLIVTGTLPSSHRGPINAELMIQTDMPGQEEVLKIRLAGVVPKR